MGGALGIPARVAACVIALAFGSRASGGAVDALGIWQWVDAPPETVARGEAWVRPRFHKGVLFDADAFEKAVAHAPMEFTPEAVARPLRLQLPMPDGTFQDFDVWESPIMEPGLAAQLPGVKTWAGQGVDDPTATLRMDLTPQGFHAQVLSVEGSFYIDPYTRGETTYLAVYDTKDNFPLDGGGWRCMTDHAPAPLQPTRERLFLRSGTFLQTYRLACAATGEFTAFHGGTVAAAQAAIVTIINRVTGVFEREVSIRLVLIANNTNIVFTNPITDEYTDGDPQTMLFQNQIVIDNRIGFANYDIGHVLGALGGGGVAVVGTPCFNANKAAAASTTSIPNGSDFHTFLICHEMGHQFGTFHSFNGINGSCGPNRTAQDAYEPGSGSTIMSYAGICSADNLQAASDLYYSHESFEDMLEYTTGDGGCPANISTGNNVPVVTAGGDYIIPRQTPFVLTGSASDLDNDPLTYCWEQRDLGPAQGALNGVIVDLGSGPIIRSFPPTSSPIRIIPRLANLLSNTSVLGEALPNSNRTMHFRLTVRDNRSGGGGVNTDDMSVTCTNLAGPFRIISPNGGGTLSGPITVFWSVASTNTSPVNCANVRIELSTDGGNTWPTTLIASTPNDGSQQVTLPASGPSTCRVRVSAVNNIFFDVSDANFSLTPPPGPGPFNLTSPASGETDVPLSPVLAWSASAGALSYIVTLDSEPTFTPPWIIQIGTGFRSYVVPEGTLDEGTTYYWRVIANNMGGTTSGTPALASFTTVPPAPCDGDADGDFDRDFADITEVLTFFGFDHSPALDGPGDASHDGLVNFADVTSVLTSWSLPCGK